MRRWDSCCAELALALALGACGPRSAEPEPVAPSADAPVHVSELSLRNDHVRRLREMRAAMRQGDPRHRELDQQLADALVGLAKYHRGAAIEADPKAAAIPPPSDRHPPRPGDASEAEAEIASDAPPPPEPPDLPRNDPAFAALAPAARAHVRAADRCVLEALTVIRQLSWAADAPPREPRKLAAREAELLEEIGQLSDARSAWYRVLRDSVKDSLSAKAYLGFADWFATQPKKKVEMSALLEKAAAAAAAVKDAPLLRKICARAREAAAEPPTSCVDQ